MRRAVQGPAMRAALVIAAGVAASAVAHAGAYEDFFRAVPLDNTLTVAELLARGFDANATDERGQPALSLAIREGAPKVVAFLLKQPGLQVDQPNAAAETPLMLAALRGNIEWMTQLLARGAQVNRAGWTPLHYAASSENPAAVELLLGRGAAVDARAPNGNTALMMAARYGNEASVEPLLKAGADTGLRNERGMAASDFARATGREALAGKLATAKP
jgi:ankyrin repeat protein